ncbi:DUF2490 domain-containing protein [Flavobacterium selenitireducens]|uniref:DUF2490 domain-containing protein n=1 Tax=Flavobacterium selenitireducens TaxID=2722704 RepID=UPI00168B9CC3|nr:DUF2490 domain-containing protein [Flavobacterium selenitireducens]MBD3582606.1 DUF2490 domain-containing protein [Flavobacterium selenitireducens]
MRRILFSLSALAFFCTDLAAQTDKTGGWYIYFGNIKPKESKFSIDVEAQYRNHNLGGDLQQLLLRSGIKYNFAPNFNATAGYAYVLTEAEDTPDNPVRENRAYQEGVLSQNASRLFFRHRFRYEQRWVEGRDFNTRYRYCLFLDVPLNKPSMVKNAAYIALYNEIFINGMKTDDTRNIFDRDRIYLGAGYKFADNFALQLGWMNQMLETSNKSQVMISLHHRLDI